MKSEKMVELLKLYSEIPIDSVDKDSIDSKCSFYDKVILKDFLNEYKKELLKNSTYKSLYNHLTNRKIDVWGVYLIRSTFYLQGDRHCLVYKKNADSYVVIPIRFVDSLTNNLYDIYFEDAVLNNMPSYLEVWNWHTVPQLALGEKIGNMNNKSLCRNIASQMKIRTDKNYSVSTSEYTDEYSIFKNNSSFIRMISNCSFLTGGIK